MGILIGWLSPLRTICMAIDSIAFTLIDDAYNIVMELAGATLYSYGDDFQHMLSNLYILFGIVAFFRLALVLVNSVIDPEKLSEKGKGLGNIFFRVVGMLLILAVTPLLFSFSYEVQKLLVGKPNVITGDDNPYGNVILKLFLGDNANVGGTNAGKQLRNITLSSLITIDDEYLVNEGAVCTLNDSGQVLDENGTVRFENISEALNSGNDTDKNNDYCGFIPAKCISIGDNQCQMQGGYVPDTSNDKCDWDNCQNAVALYNEMYVQNDMSPRRLAGYVGTSADLTVDGSEQDVYVYNYMFIVTTIVGVFITLVILSFAVDLAIRMFELIVLQITAPLFIATFVDPKSAQSGPFKNWLSAVGKSYASLYIRLLILSLMILLITVVNESDIFDNMGSVSTWAKLFVIIGLLIFLKKAPKWISELIGIKSDGLGGLWSPKKLRENMLGGAMLAGAAKGLAGSTYAAGKNLFALGRNRRQARKEYKDALANSAPTEEARKRDIANRMRELKRRNPGMTSQQAKTLAQRAYERDQKQKAKDLKKDFNLNPGAAALQLGSALFNAAGSFNASAKGDKLSTSLKSANDRSNAFIKGKGLRGESLISKAGDAIKGLGSNINDAAFGNAYQRQERIDAITKAKNEREWYKDGHGINSKKAFGDAIKINGGKIAGNEEDAFVVMGAKKAGISADAIAYDNDGNLTINGNAISANDRNSYINSITSNLTDSGFAHYAEMFNNVQSNSSSEYQNNMQQMQQMSSMMGTLQDTISKSINGIGDKFKSIGDSFKDFTKSGLSFNTSDGSLKVDLGDGKDIKVTAENLSNGEFMKALKDADPEKAEYFEKTDGLISDLKTFAENKDAEYDRIAPFITQYQNSVNEYSRYNARQEQLRPIIQGAKYIVDTSTGRITGEDSSATTLSGIENKFSREASKIKEKLDFIEQKQKNNNDSGS